MSTRSMGCRTLPCIVVVLLWFLALCASMRTGNTALLSHPIDWVTTIPTARRGLRESIPPFLFLGPVIPAQLWRNATARWCDESLVAAGLSRYFVELHEPSVDIDNSWTLVDTSAVTQCFQSDRRPPPSMAAAKLEGDRCDAFRTPQGPVAFGVFTWWTSLWVHRSLGASCTLKVRVLEESRQIFHPDDVARRSRAIRGAVVAELCQRGILLEERDNEDRQPPDCSRLHLRKLFHGVRGLSLMSVEKLGRCSVPPALVSVSRQGMTLGIVTQNIWNFNGDWRQRRALLAQDMAAADRSIGLGVDVMMFQEVRYHSDAPSAAFRSNNLDNGKVQSSELMFAVNRALRASGASVASQGAFDASYAFQPAMTYVHFDRFGPPRVEVEGLMAAVRARVRADGVEIRHFATSHTLLSRDAESEDDAHQRLLLCVVLLLTGPDGAALPPRRIDVCTTHFSLGDTHQLRNAQESVALMDSLALRTHFDDQECGWDSKSTMRAHATVLTGDLNSEPHNEVAAALTAAGFVDMWPSCPGAELNLGFTFNTNDEELLKRIDFVYVKQHADRQEAGRQSQLILPQNCVLLGRRADNGTVSSDHLGVAMWLGL